VTHGQPHEIDHTPVPTGLQASDFRHVLLVSLEPSRGRRRADCALPESGIRVTGSTIASAFGSGLGDSDRSVAMRDR